MRLQGADKGSVRRHAGNDGIEDSADSILHSDRGETLGHFALDLAGCVLFRSAIRGYGREFVIGIRTRSPGKHSLDQALGDDIWKAAIGSSGVSVILHRETEMPGRGFAWALEDVFARGRLT